MALIFFPPFKIILQPCTIKLNVTKYRFIIIDNSFLKQTYIPAKLTSIRQSYSQSQYFIEILGQFI